MKGYIERIEGVSPYRNNFVPSTEPYIKRIKATKEQKETFPNSDFHDCGCIVNCNCNDTGIKSAIEDA